MKESTKIWYEYIKAARLSQGKTQLNVADKTGLTLRSYQRIEAGKQWPSYDTLKKISEILSIQIIIP
jgi:transcriptional regulator with XRE-family HTH domain